MYKDIFSRKTKRQGYNPVMQILINAKAKSKMKSKAKAKRTEQNGVMYNTCTEGIHIKQVGTHQQQNILDWADDKADIFSERICHLVELNNISSY